MLFSCKISLLSNGFSSVSHKYGCFKRKKLYQEQESDTSLQAGTPPELTPAPTKEILSQSDGESELPLDEQSLLDDGEANGTAMPCESEEILD